jgi:hypothetical protein
MIDQKNLDITTISSSTPPIHSIPFSSSSLPHHLRTRNFGKNIKGNKNTPRRNLSHEVFERGRIWANSGGRAKKRRIK